MKLSLNQPYPVNESIKWRLVNCILFGTFVFLFLFIFQPFELSKLPKHIGFIALGYGLVCVVVMTILNVGFFMLFPSYFSESNWTTRNEITWSILNVFCIGIANYFFSILIHVAAFTWMNLFRFEMYTTAVAVFPITISILINQVRLINQFERQSAKINETIDKKQNREPEPNVPSTISITNGNETFELVVEDFLFAKSEDNYVNVYYLNNQSVSRKMLRNTLKQVYSMCAQHPNILKCHKSYLVNLKHVQRFSGNAQGYKLHVLGTDEVISVSRSLNETIKQYFTGSH